MVGNDSCMNNLICHDIHILQQSEICKLPRLQSHSTPPFPLGEELNLQVESGRYSFEIC
jgi:hypothetical protein